MGALTNMLRRFLRRSSPSDADPGDALILRPPGPPASDYWRDRRRSSRSESASESLSGSMSSAAGGGYSGAGRGDFRGSQWVGRAKIKGKHRWQRMALVTVSMLGLQLVWSTEMSQASPYLLTLGLSKSLMAMVFLAGPLSGLIVQPLIGIFADRCKSPLGRRRPYIIAGCAVSAASLLLFGWATEVASIFARRGGVRHAQITRWFAVVAVYCLDFSINVVQAADRSLLVDVVPPSQQHNANAWAGRQAGVGAIIGFWISNANLPATPFLRFFGDSQIKIVSLIACFLFLVAHAITCVSVEERVLLEDDTEFDEMSRQGITGAVRQIYRVWRTLPRSIKQICDVQFFSWIGWFPILFFSTTWVAEIWFRSRGIAGLEGQNAAQIEAATRAGSYAMLWHAMVSFVTAVALPIVVSSGFEGANTYRERWNPPRSSDSSLVDALLHTGYRIRRLMPPLPLPWLTTSMTWMASQCIFAFLMLVSLFATRSLFLGTMIIGATGFCWGVTNWAPFALLGETILLDGGSAKNTPMPRQGSWRAPLTPIAEEPSRVDDSLAMTPRPQHQDPRPLKKGRGGMNGGLESVSSPRSARMPSAKISRESLDGDYATPPGYASPPVTGEVLELRHSESFDTDRGDESVPSLRDSTTYESRHAMPESHRYSEGDELEMEMDTMDGVGEEGTADSAGVILGIHNIYVVIPQLIVTFISSIVFAFLAPGESVIPSGEAAPKETIPPTDDVLLAPRAPQVNESSWDAVGLIFRLGGISAAVSAWVCWRMMRERDFGGSRGRIG